MQKTRKVFVEGAYLFTLDKELSTNEFIQKAGGMKEIMDFLKEYEGMIGYISLVLDDPKHPHLIGHGGTGNTIGLTMSGYGHKNYQTMELKKW